MQDGNAEYRFKKKYPAHFVKAMDTILAMPSGPKRWRASAALCLNINPMSDEGITARYEHETVVAENKALREEQANDFASSVKYQTERDGSYKDGFLRLGLHMPTIVMTFIEMFNKWDFDSKNPDCKKNLQKLMKEFRAEYTIPVKI